MDGGAMDNLPVRGLAEYTNDKDLTLLSEVTQRSKTLSFMLKRSISREALI